MPCIHLVVLRSLLYSITVYYTLITIVLISLLYSLLTHYSILYRTEIIADPLQYTIPYHCTEIIAVSTYSHQVLPLDPSVHIYCYMFTILINTISWIGVKLCVCVSVTDVPSLPQRVLWERGYNVYRNAYAGNESPS